MAKNHHRAPPVPLEKKVDAQNDVDNFLKIGYDPQNIFIWKKNNEERIQRRGVREVIERVLIVKIQFRKKKNICFALQTEWSSSLWHGSEGLHAVSLRGAKQPATLFTWPRANQNICIPSTVETTGGQSRQGTVTVDLRPVDAFHDGFVEKLFDAVWSVYHIAMYM